MALQKAPGEEDHESGKDHGSDEIDHLGKSCDKRKRHEQEHGHTETEGETAGLAAVFVIVRPTLQTHHGHTAPDTSN